MGVNLIGTRIVFVHIVYFSHSHTLKMNTSLDGFSSTDRALKVFLYKKEQRSAGSHFQEEIQIWTVFDFGVSS